MVGARRSAAMRLYYAAALLMFAMTCGRTSACRNGGRVLTAKFGPSTARHDVHSDVGSEPDSGRSPAGHDVTRSH